MARWLFATLLSMMQGDDSFGVREGAANSLFDTRDADSAKCRMQETWSQASKKCVEKPWSDYHNCVEEKNENGCKENDWVKEHCTETCALEFADLVTVLDEGVPHAADNPGMGCAPPAERLSALAGLIVSPPSCAGAMPFYLDESDAFNMTELHSCWFMAWGNVSISELAGVNLRVDDYIDNDKAQHLADFHLLQQLRSHPMRVHDPDAACIHFTGITPALSYFSLTDKSEWYKSQSCRDMSDVADAHQKRMEAAASQLKKLVTSLKEDKQRVYVIASTYWASTEALGALIPLMESPVGKKRILFATSDLTWAQRGCNLYANYVTLPYVASYRMDKTARGLETSCSASDRDVDFFFAGTFSRCGGHCDTNEGGLRGNVIRAMDKKSNSSIVIDLLAAGKDLMYARGKDAADEARLYAERMLRSKFCLVAAGDTKTSRRLFESLAAGCIPVYLGYFEGEPGGFSMAAPHPLANNASNLPFRTSVDWSSLVIFAGGMKCLNANEREVASSLGHMLAERSESPDFDFEYECKRRRKEYLRSLSYYEGGAVVTSLLTELYTSRIPDRVKRLTCSTVGG
jgi:hypothetical protein